MYMLQFAPKMGISKLLVKEQQFVCPVPVCASCL